VNQEPCQRRNESFWRGSSYKCSKCSKCSDTGWILIDKKESAPLAVSCNCREADMLKSYWKAAGINPEKSTHTFGSFQVWNDTSRKAKDTAIAYFKDFQKIQGGRKNSIMFCGQPGSGKTHLSIALALNFLDKNIKVVYMPYRDNITKIKQNMLDNDYYKKMISNYQLCEILLVDDLYKGKINDTDINVMFEILNYCYLNHLPIIVSLNLQLRGF
jgi:DNA replication protein DnaC